MCNEHVVDYYRGTVTQATGWLVEEVMRMLDKGVDVSEMMLTDLLFLENLVASDPDGDRVTYPNLTFDIPSLEGAY